MGRKRPGATCWRPAMASPLCPRCGRAACPDFKDTASDTVNGYTGTVDCLEAALASALRERDEARAGLAAVRAEYEKAWTPLPDESEADLMRTAVEAAAAEHARFKARGGELDAMEAERDAAREALRANGIHAAECATYGRPWRPCSCGPALPPSGGQHG